jgi:uncharacterized protein (DUF2141 family)
LLSAAAPIATLDVAVQNVRSHHGVLRFCLTGDPKNFPGCVDDAHAMTRTVPAGTSNTSFDGLPRGDYAVAVIHDENNNAKLDTVLGIPREGFGFSRNPPIHFGAPRFAAARFTIDSDRKGEAILMRYLF